MYTNILVTEQSPFQEADLCVWSEHGLLDKSKFYIVNSCYLILGQSGPCEIGFQLTKV